jgi:hypothetical protein
LYFFCMSLANQFLFFEVEIQFENNKRCENVEPAMRDPRTVGRVENLLVFHAFHGLSFSWRSYTVFSKVPVIFPAWSLRCDSPFRLMR